jgi:site-specific recombinase XerD
VAARLAVVGIRKLEELTFWIRLKGFHWHRGIPKVGPEGAACIVRWLREHEATLGALPSPALVPLSQVDTAALTPPPRIGIVPLERFRPPSERDGSSGTNRAPVERCKVAAANDYEAIQAWLRLRVQGTHTWRAYRKEAERFLLWAVMERRKALSSLDGDDCVAYRDFLAAPGPEWVGPRNAQRWSEAWRPFEGPLSVRSQATAMTIVRSLCEWLVRRHYLDSNPWDDVPARPDAPSMPQLRALSQKQWQLVQEWIDGELAEAPSPALHRLKFILDFGYMTGMRLAELAAAKLGWLRHEQLDDGEWAWSIMVLGKRNKWREVPLPDPALDALRAYLDIRGLRTEIFDNDPETPLIAKLSLDAPLTTARIYEVLVTGFERCAANIAVRDWRAAERIREASTHWLRHTYGTHSAARGVPQDVLQANLGHESLATTSIYVRAEKARRHRAVQSAFEQA